MTNPYYIPQYKFPQDFSQYAQQAGAGIGAGMASPNPQGFSVDPMTPIQGGLQGFAAGGPVGAVVGATVGQIKEFAGINKNLKNLDTSVQGVSYDAYGRPVYQGGDVSNAMNTLEDLNDGSRSINKSLAPSTHLFNKIFGTTNRIEKRRNELQTGIQQAQNQYNQQDIAFREQQNAYMDYRQRLNPRRRLQNLYRWTN